MFSNNVILFKPIPKFDILYVENGLFDDFTFDKYLGKYVVLFFYDIKNNPEVFPDEIITISKNRKIFEELNVVLLAVSNDNVFTLTSLILHNHLIHYEQNPVNLNVNIDFPLLADKNNEIALYFNVWNFKNPHLYQKKVIIINPQGIIKKNFDSSIKKNIDKVIKSIREFKFTDAEDLHRREITRRNRKFDKASIFMFKLALNNLLSFNTL
ncbi:thioredoxin-like protein [Rhizophagus irregularis]|uniref:Thioredoxin-like protein n=1 Tax=Rhizophagus irregularis TaxID=588596 RepID=A0A2I1E535_9GLOM|nr:thioredoxin-like protein [Rhizophagus irregularis]PKC70633.1 thioredoxin-like protein [Rhizophagus irregularis]PKY17226.1 thioredoxin-like protein [Rhizophagus irregularis]